MAEHLTTEELAERWCMTPQGIRMMRLRGEGPQFLKLPNKVIYNREAVEAYEAEHTHASTSEYEV